jgi:GWxTD domain-containing protein
MKKRSIVLIILLAVWGGLVATADAGQAKKKAPKDLPPQYRKWIEEDVPYIITPKERDVFLQLESDREREIFMTAFWNHRDPTPGTDKNEFREEHYRRITYANQWYGRDTPGPGWRSAMGRIYVILGAPKSTDVFENLYDIFPTTIWFFDGMAEFNLPNAFNVVFFKPDGSHEYKLYSPLQDGPQKLLIHYDGDMTDYENAYYKLLGIEPSIAEVSLSLVPGERRMTERPSVSSEILLSQRIPSAPLEKVKDDYAEKLLRYKDVIDVDYSANYIGNDSMMGVYRDPTGQAFVHFSIEPERLNFETSPNGYHTEVEIEGRVTGTGDRTVYQFNRSVPIDVNEGQMASIKSKLFSYQDLFPLIPGRYKVNLLWKNKVSREFTSIEAEILVPDPGTFAMSAPLLANKADKDTRYKGTNKPFLLNDIQLVPSPRNDFQSSDTLSLFFELLNVPSDLRTSGTIDYTILKADQPFRLFSKLVSEYPGGTAFYEEIPLADFPPAQYTLRISLRTAAAGQRLSAETHFYITPMISLPRPFVVSLSHPPATDAATIHILGNQYFNQGKLDKARQLLEAAYRTDPNSQPFALDFARLLIQAKDFPAVKTVAAPFLKDERKWDFLQIAGQASQALGELLPAINHYKDYLAHFGTNILVLNAIGECWLGLGNPAETRIAWEKSLELNAKQPELRERLNAIKDKK